MYVLIVDDNPRMRILVRRCLNQGSYENLRISEASNGIEALNIIHDETPDLILSDWNMPKMNGLRLLQSLRSEKSTVLFGFITAQNTLKIRKQAVQYGANFLLSKPFSPTLLNAEILTLFS
jgi:two-component system chemotaxis response regulator CheY